MLSFPQTLAQYETRSFTVVLDTTVPTQFAGQFQITSTDIDQSPFTVSIRGSAFTTSPPEIDVNYGLLRVASTFSTVDFGNPGSGQSPVRTLTVTNRGAGPLLLSSIVVPSDFSMLSPAFPQTLATLDSTFEV